MGAKSGSKTDDQLQQILEYLSQHKECTRSDIELLLSVKASRAGKLLNILIEDEKLLRYGSGRKYAYKIKK